ncbi:MAG: SUMF1/EgtB/PvdO family nonheme iron enzyme [Bacteroidetes bacterium]|nr:SUMF1/EgtB/PvdO family nonheme iron enzyme [Bacteroidota bacterium]
MMKNSIFILSLILLFSSFSIKRKKKKLIPPGTVQISETFFADETEISNFGWMEYEYWTKTKYGANSPEHIAVLPDTLVWREKNTYNEPYVKYYYRHPAYKNFPVVGISFEQALAYCKWRTDRVKEYSYKIYKTEWKVEYRLPTKEEWELLSNNGSVELANKGRNDKGKVKFNHCYLIEGSQESMKFMTEHADITAPVYSYWKNAFGMYNVFGNVAEMISEEGQSKGGGWRSLLEECRAGNSIPYKKPTAWLGFRCVCVVNNN